MCFRHAIQNCYLPALFYRFHRRFFQTGDVLMTAFEQEPYFSGCEQYSDGSPEKNECSLTLISEFIAKNLVYPTEAIEKNIQGKVYVRFIVEENGNIANPIVVRDIGYGCGEAALEVVRRMPSWQPGKTKGKAVRVTYTLPIRFSLEGRVSDNAAGYSLIWGNLKKDVVTKKELKKYADEKIIVRDDIGDILPVNELTFSREHNEIFEEVRSNGVVTPKMMSIVRNLRKNDTFILTVTVQKAGEFHFVSQSYRIE